MVEATATVTQLTISLIVGGLGAGILSMPWSAAGASVIPSIIIAILVLGINAWTIMILVITAEKYQEFDVAALLSKLPGRMGKISFPVFNVLVWLTMFGCLIGYMIVVADAMAPLTGEAAVFSSYPFNSREFWIISSSVILIPICFLPMKYLSFTSTLSLVVTIYLLVLINYNWAVDDTPKAICYMGIGRGSIAYLSTMMYSVAIQMCVLPMYQELENRTPKKFFKVIVYAFGTLMIIYCAFSVCGYFSFGGTVPSNVLTAHWALSENIVYTVRLGTVLVVIGVYPVMMFPMIAPLRTLKAREDKKRSTNSDLSRISSSDLNSPFLADDSSDSPINNRGSSSSSSSSVTKIMTQWWVIPVVTIVIIACAMALAFVIPNLGEMTIINGAASCIGFISLCPFLIGFFMMGSGTCTRIGLVCLLVSGTVIGILGFIYKDNYIQDVDQENCYWGSFPEIPSSNTTNSTGNFSDFSDYW